MLKIYTVNKFQVYDTVLLTIVPMLYIRINQLGSLHTQIP